MACAVAITLFSLAIPLIIILRQNSLLSAQVEAGNQSYDNNYVIAGASIQGNDAGSLNRFVLKEFGAMAECYWSEKLILCTDADGNKTESYTPVDEP